MDKLEGLNEVKVNLLYQQTYAFNSRITACELSHEINSSHTSSPHEDFLQRVQSIVPKILLEPYAST